MTCNLGACEIVVGVVTCPIKNCLWVFFVVTVGSCLNSTLSIMGAFYETCLCFTRGS